MILVKVLRHAQFSIAYWLTDCSFRDQRS